MTASAIAAARAVIRRLAKNNAAAGISSQEWCPLDVAMAAFGARLPRHISVECYYATLPTAPPSTTPTRPSALSSRASTTASDPYATSAGATTMATQLSALSTPPPAGATNVATHLSTPPPPPPPPAAKIQGILKSFCLPPTAPHGASSVLSTTGSRLFSSATASATPTPPTTDLTPRSVLFLIDLLNGLVLTPEEELMFRKAFNEKFCHFKVADIVEHLKAEDFTIEEYCFMLKIIHSKLGPNRELAELLLKEGINLPCTNDEAIKYPMLTRVETKLDVLTKKVDKGNYEILKCVQVSNKGEWGTIEVLGKKLDLTKLEFLRKLINMYTGL